MNKKQISIKIDSRSLSLYFNKNFSDVFYFNFGNS